MLRTTVQCARCLADLRVPLVSRSTDARHAVIIRHDDMVNETAPAFLGEEGPEPEPLKRCPSCRAELAVWGIRVDSSLYAADDKPEPRRA